MKKALLFLALFVAGCVSPGQVCNSYGFTPGTSEFAQCLLAEMQRRPAMGAQSLQYFQHTNQPATAPAPPIHRPAYQPQPAIPLGLMVADPGDIAAGRHPGLMDGEFTARSIERYRKGAKGH